MSILDWIFYEAFLKVIQGILDEPRGKSFFSILHSLSPFSILLPSILWNSCFVSRTKEGTEGGNGLETFRRRHYTG